MKTVEEIATEVCDKIGPVAMCKNPITFSVMVVAAVNAERGKDVVGYDAIFNAIAMSVRGNGGLDISVKAFKDALGGEIFLSPTIPPGFAMVPIEPTQEMCEQAYYEFNAEQKDFDAANLYRAMIHAAGVTK